MTFSDEQLMAYADGEADDALRAQIAAAIARDAQLAAKVAQHQALRKRLHAELDTVLTEPVPDRLLAALRAPVPHPTANNSTGNVVVLPTANGSNKVTQSRRYWNVREWSAMVAALVLGVGLGVITLNGKNADLLAVRNGDLVAQGKLASALTQQLASTQSAVEPVQIGTSFNSRAGDFCRTFFLQQKRILAGLACYRGDEWRVLALTEMKSGSVNTINYRQAGSAMPAAITALVEEEISNEPLDAEGEAAARQAGWRR